jgi:hypothetical protein
MAGLFCVCVPALSFPPFWSDAGEEQYGAAAG